MPSRVLSLIVVLCASAPLGAAVVTWSGAGGDGRFANPANWGGATPQAGDDLVIVADGATALVNDLAACPVGSLNIAGAMLSGDPLMVSGAIVCTADARVGGIVLGGPVVCTVASGATLTLTAQLDNRGHDLRLDGEGQLVVAAPIVGVGGLSKDGHGQLTLAAVSTFTGAVALRGGEVRIEVDAPASGDGAFGAGGAAVACNGVRLVLAAGRCERALAFGELGGAVLA
ncbi:MAG: hypothetical protein H0W72_08690, partial [Planctomycetes bacterium]|nr:hypothetical protein [Planctomycetota bacterium]